jgi:hypothetical protein
MADDGTDARGSVRRDTPRGAFPTPASGGRAGAVSREAVRERGAVFRQPAPGGNSVPAAGRDGVRKVLLGNECLPNSADLVGRRPGGVPSFAMELSANDEVSRCCTSEHGHGDW